MLSMLAGGGLIAAPSAAQGNGGLPAPGLTARFDNAAPTAIQGQDLIPLDPYTKTQLSRAHMPGLSAAIVKNGQIVWTGAYGYSRVNTKEPVTSETLFELASVSKTVIATAVMQVWESGFLDLNADINLYLPFKVVNPLFPDLPITTRMLLAHTSSIHDVGFVYVNGCPLYPAGWVITSAPQLARHLIAFIQYGEVDGVRILQPETIEEMRRIQYPEVSAPLPFGLAWYYKTLQGWELLGHEELCITH